MNKYHVIFRNGKMFDYQNIYKPVNAGEDDTVLEVKFDPNASFIFR